MNLTHLALIMTTALLGVTGWLAWDQHSDARGSRNQLELMQRQRNGGATSGKATDVSELQARETELLMAQAEARKYAASKKDPVLPPPPIGTNPGNKLSALESSGHVSAAALEASPPALTPRQRLLMSLPAIAQVSEAKQEYGFVVITAGADKKLEQGSVFALRRGKAVIGRIKVTEVEKTNAVANLQAVPLGVDIQIGDDVVQDLPPES